MDPKLFLKDWKWGCLLLVFLFSVHLKSKGQFPRIFNLDSLNGQNGFIIEGEANRDYAGYRVSAAGDINGDGLADLIIGAPGPSEGVHVPNPTQFCREGKSYVVFGRNWGFDARFSLSDLNGQNGFMIVGTDPCDYIGEAICGVGDINSDGIDDLLLGASNVTRGGLDEIGGAYIIYGRKTGFSPRLYLSNLSYPHGFVIKGTKARNQMGYSVSGGGDLNGDGIADFIIGAPSYNSTVVNGGETYVIFGRENGFGSSLDLSTLDGNNGFVIKGIGPHDRAGNSVSHAGDINGDGVSDLVIGALFADQPWGIYAGESYVVFGKRGGFDPSLELADLNGLNGFSIKGKANGDELGIAVSGAGDINGDGLDDILIAAPYADPNGKSGAGESYVIFGRSQNFPDSINLSELSSDYGFSIQGIDEGDASGRSLCGAGDVNGDGLNDLIIGAPWANWGIDDYIGEGYVIYGKRSGFGSKFELITLNGYNGFTFKGFSYKSLTGYSVSRAGDINGDGVDDFLVGAPFASSIWTAYAGQVYVVFGNNTPVDPPPVPTDQEVWIFPNPASEEIFIRSTALLYAVPTGITFFDCLGKSTIVPINKVDYDLLNLDLRSLSAGVYFFRLEVEGNVTIQRIIKF